MPRLIKRRKAAKELIQERLVGDVMEAYADWREESMSVGEAYGRWAGAPVADAPLAFAAYVAALDREQRAEERYAFLIGRAGLPRHSPR